MLGLDAEGPYPHLPVCIVPLVGTLEESIRAVDAEWRDNYEAGLVDGVPSPGFVEGGQRLSPLIALLLYLCADEAEIGDDTVRAQRPKPTKTKQGWRLFPAPRADDMGRWRTHRCSDPASAGTRGRRQSHCRRTFAASCAYSACALGNLLDRAAVR